MKKFGLLFINLFLFATLGFAKTDLSTIKKYSVDTLYSKLQSKDADVIQAVKSRKLNLNKESILGYTVLSYAAIDNNLEIVKLLLESGAKPDAGINFPLYEACWAAENISNRYDVINLLLQYGANINKKHRNTSYTPLMATIKRQKGYYASFLILKGAKVNLVTSDGETALMLAIDYKSKRNDSMVVKKLIESGANVNAIAKNGNTALSIACNNADIEVVRMLLESGAVATVTDKNKNEIPVLNACYSGSYDCVRELLKYGADLNVKDSYGATALLLSCMSKDSPELVSLCISYGADVNYVDPLSGHTAFTLAAIWNHPKQMEILFNYGANTNYTNPNIGNTLKYIIANGVVESESPFFHSNDLGGAIYGIEHLMFRPLAVPNIRPYIIKYLNMAKTEEKRAEYKKLLEVTIRESYKGTPAYTIYEAAILNKTENMKAFVSDSSIFLEQIDSEGYTALDYAKKYGNAEIEAILLNAGVKK